MKKKTHIRVKLQNIRDKEKILKLLEEWGDEGTGIKTVLGFSIETLEDRRQ